MRIGIEGGLPERQLARRQQKHRPRHRPGLHQAALFPKRLPHRPPVEAFDASPGRQLCGGKQLSMQTPIRAITSSIFARDARRCR